MAEYHERIAEAIREGQQAAARKYGQSFEKHFTTIVNTIKAGTIQEKYRIQCLSKEEMFFVRTRFDTAKFKTQGLDNLSFFVCISTPSLDIEPEPEQTPVKEASVPELVPRESSGYSFVPIVQERRPRRTFSSLAGANPVPELTRRRPSTYASGPVSTSVPAPKTSPSTDDFLKSCEEDLKKIQAACDSLEPQVKAYTSRVPPAGRPRAGLQYGDSERGGEAELLAWTARSGVHPGFRHGEHEREAPPPKSASSVPASSSSSTSKSTSSIPAPSSSSTPKSASSSSTPSSSAGTLNDTFNSLIRNYMQDATSKPSSDMETKINTIFAEEAVLNALTGIFKTMYPVKTPSSSTPNKTTAPSTEPVPTVERRIPVLPTSSSIPPRAPPACSPPVCSSPHSSFLSEAQAPVILERPFALDNMQHEPEEAIHFI